jgi:TPP-dependent pyruvate/acetoin dehydrogenase alpha subunit
MTTKQRQTIESKIARKLFQVAIAGGYSVTIFDGEDCPIQKSKRISHLMHHLRTTDEDVIRLFDRDGDYAGFVHLVYGNDGFDVIANNSTRLEALIAPVEEYAATFAV